MEPKAHHVLIGLFVVLCCGAALLFALWLGGADPDRKYENYLICFDQTVSGLAVGNSVLYSGIKVGDVVKLGLNPTDPRQVRAEIRVYSDTPIKEDTTAAIILANITGSMSVQLSGGTPESPPLRSETHEPARIRAQPSSLSALLSSGEDLMERVAMLLTQANRLLSTQNVDNISAMLANLEQLSASLAGQGDNLTAVLASIDRAALEAEQTFVDFAAVGNTARSLLEEDGNPMFASARASMEGLHTLVADLQKLFDSHDTSLARGLQGVGELEPVMRDLRSTIGNLKRITRQLDENPAKFILGRSPVQEFSP
ncbi:MAG: MlaD family protein [Desulfuromonadaceae bacterium]|nr:MlaD family protein [Desulfuromonadaceae bacterium]